MSVFLGYILFITIIIIALMAWFIYDEHKRNKSKMSFKESLDLVGLPVVTFYQHGNKYHFLLDSGASNCCINKDILSTIKHTNTNYESSMYGYDGVPNKVDIVNIDLFYKDSHFNSDFMIVDLKAAFEDIKNTSGVNITGILGSDFLSKYKYILDYKENIAYIK